MMVQNRTLEFAVGVFVALGIASLFMLAMKVSNLSAFSDQEGYKVSARFDNIGALKVRSPVTMSGVRVGRVADIKFDQQTFEAVVTLHIEQQYSQLPKDTSASIFTSGLLGEQYVGLEAGGEMDSLKDGDKIRITQSAMVMEQLIGQFLFKQAADGDGKK